MKHLIAGLLVAVPLTAAAFTGNEWSARNNGQDIERTMALGYVVGTVDTLTYAETVCPPGKVTRGQTRDIFAQWLRLNPTRTHEPAVELIAELFTDLWPCKSNDSQRQTY